MWPKNRTNNRPESIELPPWLLEWKLCNLQPQRCYVLEDISSGPLLHPHHHVHMREATPHVEGQLFVKVNLQDVLGGNSIGFFGLKNWPR